MRGRLEDLLRTDDEQGEEEEVMKLGGGWDLFLILLDTSSMDCSYEGTFSLYLRTSNNKSSAEERRVKLPGGLPVLSQRHLPVVRRHGGSRGGDAVHEGSLGRRRTRRKIHHLPQQSRHGRRLHLIFLANLLQ